MMLLHFVKFSSAAAYCDANLSEAVDRGDVAAVDRDDNDR
jgi:hypothetical protein